MQPTRTLLTVGVVALCAAATDAQAPPGPRPAIFMITEAPAAPRPSINTPIVVVDRILSFDADADHRIGRDELPERMQDLVSRGDTDRDGVLDSDEIRALITAQPLVRGAVAIRLPASDGLADVVSDLKLPPAKHDQAMAIVARAPSVPRNVNDATSVDVHARLKELLDDEEYENFVAAATRLSRSSIRIRTVERGVVGGIPAPPR